MTLFLKIDQHDRKAIPLGDYQGLNELNSVLGAQPAGISRIVHYDKGRASVAITTQIDDKRLFGTIPIRGKPEAFIVGEEPNLIHEVVSIRAGQKVELYVQDHCIVAEIPRIRKPKA